MLLSARHMRKCERGLAALEFALLAPALLMLAFGIVIYSLYFTTQFGVRQAASEGARASLQALSGPERTQLATERAQEVAAAYGSLLGVGTSPTITASGDSDVFTITVSYDISNSPIMNYAGFVPLPSSTISSTVKVTNGSY